ncbi:Hypothetical predicted protein, partial [Olea europaea subsp. europaea]
VSSMKRLSNTQNQTHSKCLVAHFIDVTWNLREWILLLRRLAFIDATISIFVKLDVENYYE